MPAVNFPNGLNIQSWGVTFDDTYRKVVWNDGNNIVRWTDNPMTPSSLDALVWDLTGAITITNLIVTNLSFPGTGYLKTTAGVVSVQAVPIPVSDGGTGSTTQPAGAAISTGTVITTEAQLAPTRGGTGRNTSADTGVPLITGGVWSTPAQVSTLRGGTGQDFSASAQGGVIYFSAAGVMSVLPAGTSGQFLQTRGAGANPAWGGAPAALTQFSGLEWRTHPDQDKAANQVAMFNLDSVVMDDSTGYFQVLRKGTDAPLTADITVNGAGGLDTGSRVASTWYELYIIGKGDGINSNCRLLLHRAKNYFLDQNQTLAGSIAGLLNSAAAQQLAQTFTPTVSGKLEFVDIAMSFTGGTVAGRRFWVEIQADSAGVPSGTALATSDKLVSEAWGGTGSRFMRFIFRSPFSVTATTKMWIVMKGDYAVDAANFITWNFNAAGTNQFYSFNGTVWTPVVNATAAYITYITQNDTAVTMPATFTGKAKIGYVFNTSGNAFYAIRGLDKSEKFVDNNGALSPFIVNGATNTTKTMFGTANSSLGLFVPPTLINMDLVAFNGAASASNIVPSPIPDGYRNAGLGVSWIDGDLTAVTFTSGTSFFPGLQIEYQGIYLGASVANYSLLAVGFTWVK